MQELNYPQQTILNISYSRAIGAGAAGTAFAVPIFINGRGLV